LIFPLSFKYCTKFIISIYFWSCKAAASDQIKEKDRKALATSSYATTFFVNSVFAATKDADGKGKSDDSNDGTYDGDHDGKRVRSDVKCAFLK
jgi:hypothetical protein